MVGYYVVHIYVRSYSGVSLEGSTVVELWSIYRPQIHLVAAVGVPHSVIWKDNYVYSKTVSAFSINCGFSIVVGTF